MIQRKAKGYRVPEGTAVEVREKSGDAPFAYVTRTEWIVLKHRDGGDSITFDRNGWTVIAPRVRLKPTY